MPTFEKQRAGLARRREESMEYLKEEKTNRQPMVDEQNRQDNSDDQSVPESEPRLNDTNDVAAPTETPLKSDAKVSSLLADASKEQSAGKHFLIVTSAIVLLVVSIMLWAYVT